MTELSSPSTGEGCLTPWSVSSTATPGCADGSARARRDYSTSFPDLIADSEIERPKIFLRMSGRHHRLEERGSSGSRPAPEPVAGQRVDRGASRGRWQGRTRGSAALQRLAAAAAAREEDVK